MGFLVRRWLFLGLLAPSLGWTGESAAQVEIRDYKFLPASLTVKAGTTATWTNGEKRTRHSLLFPGNPSVESDHLLPGDSWQRRLDKPGRCPYGGGLHPEMQGVIDVVE